MDLTTIPYSTVPNAGRLLLDYLYHYERVSAFYSGSPFKAGSYQTAAEQVKSLPYGREQVTAILKRQNESFGCGAATFANIDRLRDDQTFAVVTGQQVGLFAGPAYTLYKALTAIRLAQSLSEQGTPSVPVFWLASEDHDWEEVAETEILDEEHGLVSLRAEGIRPAQRAPVGSVCFTPVIDKVLDLLEQTLATAPARDTVLCGLRAAYRPGKTWAQAFGELLAGFFNPWGLVLLDPLDADVHSLSRPVYQRALELTDQIRWKLHERNAALRRAGYQVQAHVGNDATLLFVEREGSRMALVGAGEGFRLNNSATLTRTELTAWLDQNPRSFSPNVMFRPIVQDTLLPTIAYVGGPAEIAYLSQASAIYPMFGRSMPVIFPRASFTVIDHRLAQWLQKYGLTVEDVWRGEQVVNHKMAAAGPSARWAEVLSQTHQEVEQALSQLRQELEVFDPTLVGAVDGTREKILYQLEKLKGKISRAAVSRSALLEGRQQGLLNSLLPHGELQERRISGVYFLARYGYGLLDSLLATIRLDASDHYIISG